MTETIRRRRVKFDDTPLARSIGARIRQARLRAGLTQQQLAGDRDTKAYVSALENGSSKPSMAALKHPGARPDAPAIWRRPRVAVRGRTCCGDGRRPSRGSPGDQKPLRQGPRPRRSLMAWV